MAQTYFRKRHADSELRYSTNSLDKKEYSSLVIDDLILDVDDVSEIDTKTSSFHTKFSTTITWRDERLIPILKDIINNSPKPDGSGFL